MNEFRNCGIEIKTIMAVYLCLFCSLNKVHEQMSNEIQKRCHTIVSGIIFQSLENILRKQVALLISFK